MRRVQDTMLLEKYTPMATKELAGNRIAAAQLMQFFRSWRKGRGALLHGPPGSGKTLITRLVAAELGYELVEIGADENRGIAALADIRAASQQRRVTGGRMVFVIDELDQMESAAAILDFIAASQHPVVLIAADPYDRKYRTLRQSCVLIPFRPVNRDSVALFLSRVCQQDGIALDAGTIDRIASASAGDVRAALLDLELAAAGHAGTGIGHREQRGEMPELAVIIFKTTSFENARAALAMADDPDELVRWIASNVSAAYGNPQDRAAAYGCLSAADIFYSRIIRRQSWALQKYFFELGTAGVALAKKQPPDAVRVARPSFAPRRSTETAAVIAPCLHVSRRRVRVYGPLLRQLRSNKKLLAGLGVTAAELAAL